MASEGHSQVATPKSVKLRGRRQGERPYPTPKGKKKSSPDDSDSTDTSSSEDEGEVDEVSYRRRMYEKGPRAKGVKEIIPRRDVFEDAVSYRTYRLENLDQTYNSRVARRLSGQVKRLAITFGKEKFSGSTRWRFSDSSGASGIMPCISEFRKVPRHSSFHTSWTSRRGTGTRPRWDFG